MGAGAEGFCSVVLVALAFARRKTAAGCRFNLGQLRSGQEGAPPGFWPPHTLTHTHTHIGTHKKGVLKKSKAERVTYLTLLNAGCFEKDKIDD